jgi:hypothetical protein
VVLPQVASQSTGALRPRLADSDAPLVTNYPAVCLQGLPDSFISGPWRWGSAVPELVDGQPRILPRVYLRLRTSFPMLAHNIVVNLFVVRDRHTVKRLSGIVLESEENCDPAFSADPFVLLLILFAHIKLKLWTICSRHLTRAQNFRTTQNCYTLNSHPPRLPFSSAFYLQSKFLPIIEDKNTNTLSPAASES